MKNINRRNFIQAAGVVSVAASCDSNGGTVMKEKTSKDTSADMPLGIIKHVTEPDKDIAHVRELGFSTCQLSVTDYSAKFAGKSRQRAEKTWCNSHLPYLHGAGKICLEFL